MRNRALMGAGSSTVRLAVVLSLWGSVVGCRHSESATREDDKVRRPESLEGQLCRHRGKPVTLNPVINLESVFDICALPNAQVTFWSPCNDPIDLSFTDGSGVPLFECGNSNCTVQPHSSLTLTINSQTAGRPPYTLQFSCGGVQGPLNGTLEVATSGTGDEEEK